MPELEKYYRAEPEAWADLVELTENSDAVSKSLGLSTSSYASIRNLVGELATIEDEVIDQNRYYGLGLIACELGKKLRIPEVRHAVITWTARDTYEMRAETSPTLCVGDINLQVMDSPLKLAADHASKSMPLARSILANALQSEVRRRGDAREKGVSYDKVGFEYWPLAPSAVAGNGIAAAWGIYELMMELNHGEGLDADTAIDVPYLRSLNVKPVAARLAALRNDEELLQRTDGATLVYMDELGQPHFRKENVPGDPEPLPDNKIFILGNNSQRVLLHEKRLKCPAIQVAGLLPSMQELFLDMLEAADSMIRTRPPLTREPLKKGEVRVSAPPAEAYVILGN